MADHPAEIPELPSEDAMDRLVSALRMCVILKREVIPPPGPAAR